MSEASPSRTPRWLWFGLAAILLLDVWLRAHTFAPTVRSHLGFAPWPVVKGETEPLDCDEAAYAYMGRRMAHGDVLYRDLTENKPPLGYWIYGAAVALGGADEMAIRILPIPFVLATIALIGWIGLRLGGPLASLSAAGIYAVFSTDPYLYGNNAHLETFINLFSVASLAAVIQAARRDDRRTLLLAGLALGAATLVKQVVVTHLAVYIIHEMTRRDAAIGRRLSRIAALLAGFGATLVLSVAVLTAQGAGRAAFDDIIRYGGALATDTPPEPNAPPGFVRWFTGNADPQGKLPPPFGKTNYLVWWGSGTWPLWLASIPALAWLAFRKPATKAVPSNLAERRLVVAWTLSAWVQVALPGLYWAHYYLLPTPGLALLLGVVLADAVGTRRAITWGLAAVVTLAVGATVTIQVRDYLLVPSEALAERYKGGAQWITLRALGREIERRSDRWPTRRILIWGWQSPLYIYADMDGVSRQLFVDPLMKAHAIPGTHPLIAPRLRRIMSDVSSRPPDLVFAGDPPFPALNDFLERGYLRSRLVPRSNDGRGLWVRRDHYAEFESRPSGARR